MESALSLVSISALVVTIITIIPCMGVGWAEQGLTPQGMYYQLPF